MMQFNKKLLFLAWIFFCSYTISAQKQDYLAKTSMDKVSLIFNLNEHGVPYYAVFYGRKPVIKPSSLGLVLNDSINMGQNLNVLKIDTVEVDKTWNPIWGQTNKIRNHYKQLTVRLRKKGADHFLLNLVFRIFKDGVGFRYEFPVQPDLKNFTVSKENTYFNLTGDHKAFWIPADFDSNEYKYTTSKISEVDAWKKPILSYGNNQENRPDEYAVKTPLMLKTNKGLYMNIHEAALVDYPAMELHVNRKKYALRSLLVPDAIGNKAYVRAPFHTPWRSIIVSNKATDILASKIILNLNEPSKIKNTSWIKPMKYMGVWWEMQIGKSRWDYTNNLDSLSAEGKLIPHHKHGANTANVERYIDFASKNGIKGLLVEGWNTGWEEWTANKEQKFDFVTPYPDFDIAKITRYAKKKGVQMIMHNETGASVTSYDRQMDNAFRFMNKYGYHSVKTGYVGKIFPRGEHHDGQWMVNHFLRSIKKAAHYKTMIDIHEAVRPTGLHRTWPNFMASEAARGNEWNAFSTGNPPEHETILPFTRLIGGPMDYTPGIFKLKNYAPKAPKRRVHTTLAKQLALYVTMYSPLQMAADLPENYEAHMDAFQFIKDVAVDWDHSWYLEAEPGDFITIARKAKGENKWFVGSITDENARMAKIDFSFLPKGKKYSATVYADAKDASWDKNPEAYTVKKMNITSKSKIKQYIAPGGGVAISIKIATGQP